MDNDLVLTFPLRVDSCTASQSVLPTRAILLRMVWVNAKDAMVLLRIVLLILYLRIMIFMLHHVVRGKVNIAQVFVNFMYFLI